MVGETVGDRVVGGRVGDRLGGLDGVCVGDVLG